MGRKKGTIRSNSYGAVHQHNNKYHLKSGMCEFCGCTDAKKYEWALKKDFEHSRDISHYYELCKSCHFKYDMTDKTRNNMSKAAKKRKTNCRPVVATINGLRVVFDSSVAASRYFGVMDYRVGNNIKNNWTTKGIKFEYLNER